MSLLSKNSYYKRKYGITSTNADERRQECGNQCEICGRCTHISLSIDHFHFRITATRTKELFKPKWQAQVTPPFKGTSVHFAETKEKAIKAAKAEALPLSIRGVLCHSCNRGLPFFYDNPALFLKAASYLIRFTDKIKLDN